MPTCRVLFAGFLGQNCDAGLVELLEIVACTLFGKLGFTRKDEINLRRASVQVIVRLGDKHTIVAAYASIGIVTDTQPHK